MPLKRQLLDTPYPFYIVGGSRGLYTKSQNHRAAACSYACSLEFRGVGSMRGALSTRLVDLNAQPYATA